MESELTTLAGKTSVCVDEKTNLLIYTRLFNVGTIDGTNDFTQLLDRLRLYTWSLLCHGGRRVEKPQNDGACPWYQDDSGYK